MRWILLLLCSSSLYADTINITNVPIADSIPSGSYALGTTGQVTRLLPIAQMSVSSAATAGTATNLASPIASLSVGTLVLTNPIALSALPSAVVTNSDTRTINIIGTLQQNGVAVLTNATSTPNVFVGHCDGFNINANSVKYLGICGGPSTGSSTAAAAQSVLPISAPYALTNFVFNICATVLSINTNLWFRVYTNGTFASVVGEIDGVNDGAVSRATNNLGVGVNVLGSSWTNMLSIQLSNAGSGTIQIPTISWGFQTK